MFLFLFRVSAKIIRSSFFSFAFKSCRNAILTLLSVFFLGYIRQKLHQMNGQCVFIAACIPAMNYISRKDIIFNFGLCKTLFPWKGRHSLIVNSNFPHLLHLWNGDDHPIKSLHFYGVLHVVTSVSKLKLQIIHAMKHLSRCVRWSYTRHLYSELQEAEIFFSPHSLLQKSINIQRRICP